MFFRNRTYHITTSIITFFLCIAFLSNHAAIAALHPDDTEAKALKDLGIFLGNENGFALNEEPTRVEAAVVLLRILGKESEAIEENLPHNFDDIPNWADAQIGYLYQCGLVKGMSNTHFGNDPVDFNQMMTMILRALGYNDETGDFVWNSAAEKAKALFVITPWCYDVITASGDFIRKDLVSCIYYALQATMKNTEITLIRQLLNDSVITEKQIKKTGLTDLLVAANLVQNDSKHCYLSQEFTITSQGSNAYCALKVNLPDNYFNRQKVIAYTFSISPDDYYYDDGSLYAIYQLTNINKETVIKITTETEIYHYDLETAEELNFPIQLAEEDTEKYTSATDWIESDDPTFKNADFGATDGSDIQKIKAIMRYVSQHMNIQITDYDVSALTAFQQGYGDCFEYSLVFAALCRANKLPARVIICDVVKESAPGHAIAEVFMTGYGWVPFDPVNIESGADTLYRSDHNYNFVYLSCNPHSDFLSGTDYYLWYCSNCRCSVNEEFNW